VNEQSILKPMTQHAEGIIIVEEFLMELGQFLDDDYF
jgi:hypothetical protein